MTVEKLDLLIQTLRVVCENKMKEVNISYLFTILNTVDFKSARILRFKVLKDEITEGFRYRVPCARILSEI